jgi:hypothetical protein
MDHDESTILEGGGAMLEDDGFVPVGRITLQPPSRFLVHFDLREAQSWGPVIYAFRIAGEVVRIGKSESTLKNRMDEWESGVSRALAGNFQKGSTNPWEAFEWRRRLTEHGHVGEFLARRGPTDEERGSSGVMIPLCAMIVLVLDCDRRKHGVLGT